MSETETAVFKIYIRASIEDVWKEITRQDKAQGCFFNAWLHVDRLEEGGQYRMRTEDGKHTMVTGEILTFEPPHKYAHTFKFTQYDDDPCTVTYELTEKDGGVEFVLTAEGIPAGTQTAKGMKQGGDFIVKTLKQIVEDGQPAWGTRVMYKCYKWFQFMLPKKTRTENWPL